MDALLPSAGDPVGQELYSQGFVSGVAGASDEPDHSSSEMFPLRLW